MLFYDAMRFDILLTSKSYVFEGQPFSFPRRRLYQALSFCPKSYALCLFITTLVDGLTPKLVWLVMFS